jgi:pimeloyl-ACP methyl ester carboxylesterase
MSDYVDALGDLLDDLGVARAEVYGIGFGASAAVELARAEPARVSRLILEGLLVPSSNTRAELKATYAPPIPIERDGAHWYRTWLMLRDSLVWWPWYDRTKAAQRATSGDFDPGQLHRWTLDVMGRRESYGHLIRAALDYDAGAALGAVACPIVRVVGGATPLSAYDDQVRGLAPDAPEVSKDAYPSRHAQGLIELEGAT